TVSKAALRVSVLPACDRVGVSTSSTLRAAKKSRMQALSRARRRKASTEAVGPQSSSLIATPCPARSSAVLGEQGQQPGLVVHRDAEFAGTVELGAGRLARHHEAGLLRDAAGHLGTE